jgi:hypothetical protein
MTKGANRRAFGCIILYTLYCMYYSHSIFGTKAVLYYHSEARIPSNTAS